MSFEGWDTYIPCQHPVWCCQWWELDEGMIIPCPQTVYSNSKRQRGTLHHIQSIGNCVLLECNETHCDNRVLWIYKSFIDRHRLEE